MAFAKEEHRDGERDRLRRFGAHFETRVGVCDTRHAEVPSGNETLNLWAVHPTGCDNSPAVLRHARAITTPSLILHSKADFACPMEQAEQLFTILRRQGTEAEFVRFPDEGHDLNRTGTPQHRLERWAIVMEWLDRQLSATAEPELVPNDSSGARLSSVMKAE